MSTIAREYFTRLFEAYHRACTRTGPPPSFLQKMQSRTHCQKYQAVLVSGKTVEMEPPLADALKNVKAKVFYDGTCREALVKEYAPLGVASIK